MELTILWIVVCRHTQDALSHRMVALLKCTLLIPSFASIGTHYRSIAPYKPRSVEHTKQLGNGTQKDSSVMKPDHAIIMHSP